MTPKTEATINSGDEWLTLTPGIGKMFRLALGHTQAEVAKRAGVKAVTVMRYESGENVRSQTKHALIRMFESRGMTAALREDGGASIRFPAEVIKASPDTIYQAGDAFLEA